MTKRSDPNYEKRAKEAGMRREERHGTVVYVGSPAIVRAEKGNTKTPRQKALKWIFKRAAKVMSIAAVYIGWALLAGVLFDNNHEILGWLVLFSPIVGFLIAGAIVAYRRKVKELEHEQLCEQYQSKINESKGT